MRLSQPILTLEKPHDPRTELESLRGWKIQGVLRIVDDDLRLITVGYVLWSWDSDLAVFTTQSMIRGAPYMIHRDPERLSRSRNDQLF